MRLVVTSLLLLIAACGRSHDPVRDADPPMDVAPDRSGDTLPPLGRCPDHCSWDDGCPAEPIAGEACGDSSAWCAYCREGSSFDEVTLSCRDGVWQTWTCGCPCP
jgi:hypothetical protein